MSGLAAVLAGRERPGLYRWQSALDVDAVASAVQRAGWRFVALDGWLDADKATLLARIADALEFPDHFGHNLDALADSLSEVTDDVVLLWDGWSVLARADRRAFAGLRAVLEERADAAAPGASGPGGAGRLLVLLRGDGPELPGVPVLA